MQRGAHIKAGSKAKRRVRFRGVVADARALGVHRNTLYKVLSGIWSSRSLTQRYQALKADQGEQGNEQRKGR